MTDIYTQHRAAFEAVAAYVVLHGGERVATVAFKFPRDGAGRLYCYAHVIGTEMSRGFATGGGYDKKSAAAEVAFAKIKPAKPYHEGTIPDCNVHLAAMQAALKGDSGLDWDRRLADAGFVVWSAV